MYAITSPVKDRPRAALLVFLALAASGCAAPAPEDHDLTYTVSRLKTEYVYAPGTASPQDAEDRRCKRFARSSIGSELGLAACREAAGDTGDTPQARAAAYYHLAIIRTNLGDYEAALQAADRALAIAPDLTEAHLARAGALVHLDRYEEARTAIGAARAQGSAQIHYGYYLEGVMHDRNNEFVPAYLSFRKAAELRPGWLPAQERLDFLSHATDVQQYLAGRGG